MSRELEIETDLRDLLRENGLDRFMYNLAYAFRYEGYGQLGDQVEEWQREYEKSFDDKSKKMQSMLCSFLSSQPPLDVVRDWISGKNEDRLMEWVGDNRNYMFVTTSPGAIIQAADILSRRDEA